MLNKLIVFLITYAFGFKILNLLLKFTGFQLQQVFFLTKLDRPKNNHKKFNLYHLIKFVNFQSISDNFTFLLNILDWFTKWTDLILFSRSLTGSASASVCSRWLPRGLDILLVVFLNSVLDINLLQIFSPHPFSFIFLFVCLQIRPWWFDDLDISLLFP